MKDKMIIGVGYRARSGKDTVGEYLVLKHGFRRVAFADALKRVAGILVNDDAFGPDFKTEPTRLGITGGQLLQRVGVALRGVDENIWVAASGLHGYGIMRKARIVITDVRFANEAKAVKALGGQLWEIFRPGLPQDMHASEVGGLDIQWDRKIMNTGTLDDLYKQVEEELARL